MSLACMPVRCGNVTCNGCVCPIERVAVYMQGWLPTNESTTCAFSQHRWWWQMNASQHTQVLPRYCPYHAIRGTWWPVRNLHVHVRIQ